MTAIKVGSKWQRMNSVGAARISAVGASVTVTQVTDDFIDFVYDDPEIQEQFPKGLPSLTYDRFLEAFRELPAAPAEVTAAVDSWDYAEADRLRAAAAAACEAYNAYVQRKPDTYYPLVHFPASL